MMEGYAPPEGSSQGVDRGRCLTPPEESGSDPLPSVYDILADVQSPIGQHAPDVLGELASLLLGGGARRHEDEQLTFVSDGVLEYGLQRSGGLALERPSLGRFLGPLAVDPVHLGLQSG